MNKRRILSTLVLLLVCAGVFSQTSSENYIRIRTFLSADSSAWRDKTVYYDDMTGEKKRVTYSTVSSAMEQPVAATMQMEAGTKASARSGSVTTTVDYCGSLVFQDYSLKYIRLEDDGIWSSSDGYCFYVKDYLGNVRSVHNQYGRCVQTSQYYPFGRMWDDFNWGSGNQPFRFGGKELDKMHGLEWYDFGARMYDPGLGRFTGMDSRAEDYYDTSPYVYCLNNPLKNIDPDGRGVWSRGAKLLWHVGKSVAKNGWKALNTAETYTSAFADIQESVNTLTDANASTMDKVAAGVSLASEALPLSVGDAKEVGSKIQRIILPNGGNAKPHGGSLHNERIDKLVDKLKGNDKVSSIRKNQRQVDVNGNVVGSNRPDVQFDKDGIHTNVEYDSKKNSSLNHKKVLENNDPKARNKFYLINK